VKVDAIKDSIQITIAHKIEGKIVLETPCRDYDEYRTLPRLVSYDGVTCGLTGWNSDRGYACYQSGGLVAKVVGQ
jgi:hypothetical protein